MEWLGTALGALLSVALFAIGYRQSIGARRERARAANQEMERTFMKRFVLEEGDYEPKDLRRYIEGKAREHRVQSSALLGAEELLANVFQRVLDDDFLDATAREKVLRRIGLALDTVEQDSIMKLGPPLRSRSERAPRFLLAAMGALAALAGSVVALPTVSGGGYVASVGVSLLLIAVISVVARLREGEELESSSSPIQERGRQLQREVRRALKRSDARIIDAPGDGFDFVVSIDDKKIGLELVITDRALSSSIIADIVNELKERGHVEGLEKVFLVTSKPGLLPDLDDEFVEAVSISDLQVVVNHLRSPEDADHDAG